MQDHLTDKNLCSIIVLRFLSGEKHQYNMKVDRKFTPKYCAYCGRVAHRCACGVDDSAMQKFIARSQIFYDFHPQWMDIPYKRGVPPQSKRRERAALRKDYAAWYAALVEDYGECCANCGAEDNLVLDHILSIAKGGQSALSNLQVLCAECNRIKGKLCIDCRPDP